MDVLAVCPHLVCQNPEQTVYAGLLVVKNETFQLSIHLPAPNVLRGATINTDWRLSQILKSYTPVLKKRLEQCSSLAEFLAEFKNIVERQVSSTGSRSALPVTYYNELITQIEQLGWTHLVYVDGSFKEVHLQATDEGKRCHILKLYLAAKHPAEAPRCVVDLPAAFTPVWGHNKNTLAAVYAQFTQTTHEYQELWDVLDELDKNTWVLEPENPTRASTSRRIAIGSSGSLQLAIDAAHPRSLPECRFLGADHVTQPLKENLNRNLDKWNPAGSLYTNLQNVLEFQFPSPEHTSKEEFSVDCGICYSHRLGDKIPDQVCGDARCDSQYHQECLYEWFRSLGCRQSFNTLFGECLYCSRPITVKMPV